MKPRNTPVFAFKEPLMQENALNKFRTVVSEVSSFVQVILNIYIATDLKFSSHSYNIMLWRIVLVAVGKY